jgi:hypothetical protein
MLKQGWSNGPGAGGVLHFAQHGEAPQVGWTFVASLRLFAQFVFPAATVAPLRIMGGPARSARACFWPADKPAV